MASDDKVMAYVERELAKNPDVSNDELQAGAAKIDSSVKQLTTRQFHAKYPLQVKRRKGKGAGAKKRTTAKKTSRKKSTTRKKAASKSRSRTSRASTRSADGDGRDREAVRKVMMRFAKDLTLADNQAETIEVLAKLDRYVGDVLKAVKS